ncbi:MULTISPECIES: sensor histidine kinase [Pacificimonas]|uniref:histidine kinase n=1 Tax=Pacificimonas aurantium TaxID=1250540 RepID=A0ABS7WFA9_9SPHN|nr:MULTISPECIES: ATP-binding protein [Pacificimonas]MBZ6377076.1 sensor N-terminal transmembrane domain-containing protein [Pacificimonas aurantium]
MPKAAAATDADDSQLRWSRSWSLTTRILAVNLFAILMFAGGLVYLESFRDRLLAQRLEEMRAGAVLIAAGIRDDAAPEVRRLIAVAGAETRTRIRIYGPGGEKRLDSWDVAPPTYALADPATEDWRLTAARSIDRSIDFLVGAESPPYLDTSLPDRRQSYAEAEAALATGQVQDALRFAPDRTPLTYSAVPLEGGEVLTISANAQDITQVVRDERAVLFAIFLGVLGLSLMLTSFLARTIVRPLRRLALAAQRVRLGRSREVTVPRFKKRRDEIGELARSLSDMTAALRSRIDATETFAADVAHELKNPLASVKSAVDSLGSVRDEKLRAQLLEVARADVQRIDRLISDISDASRLDAELSRARMEPVDLAAMATAFSELYQGRGLPRGVSIAVERAEQSAFLVPGDESRLGQVVRNLIDNAVSFSPDGGRVELSLERHGDEVRLIVSDEGPGIPEGAEEKIFRRFYSERPEGEGFGQHSGLGLAISRAIVEAHEGRLTVEAARDGGRGARFIMSLPAI